jgi:hypothetical protein
MVDLEKRYGRDHKYVNYDDLRHVLDADKVVIEPGDMLLLYTGFTDEIVKMNKKVDPERATPCAASDGRDKRLCTDHRQPDLSPDRRQLRRRGSQQGRGRTSSTPLPIHNLTSSSV